MTAVALTESEVERLISAYRDGVLEPGRAVVIEVEDILRGRLSELSDAVDRVRRLHPRGSEDANHPAPGAWCPGCGEVRWPLEVGACLTRRVLEGEQDR